MSSGFGKGECGRGSREAGCFRSTYGVAAGCVRAPPAEHASDGDLSQPPSPSKPDSSSSAPSRSQLYSISRRKCISEPSSQVAQFSLLGARVCSVSSELLQYFIAAHLLSVCSPGIYSFVVWGLRLCWLYMLSVAMIT